MSKEYVFEFFGTKEEFISKIVSNKSFINSSIAKTYYLDDYMISISENEISFGIQRAGHSGGYWYTPIITELEDRTVLKGKIKYIGPDDDRSKIRKVADKIFEIFFIILLIPLLLVLQLLELVIWFVNKMLKRPKPITKEGRLIKLMEQHLSCVRRKL